jgi:hypothetical protein
MKPFIRKSSDTPALSRVKKARELEEAFEGARLSMDRFLSIVANIFKSIEFATPRRSTPSHKLYRGETCNAEKFTALSLAAGQHRAGAILKDGASLMLIVGEGLGWKGRAAGEDGRNQPP